MAAAKNIKHAGSWFGDAIVYHILVDRFAGYDPGIDPARPVYLGGNLKGIMDKLGYLEVLGINTLWLSPVYRNIAYHGYHITDFYSTDKHFGSEKELKHLIDQAHKRNIRVLLDFVPNHCSRHHPFFQEALNDKKSKYRRWFYFSSFGNRYLSFLDFPELPKINLDYQAARDHIILAARKWIGLGIDGYRLDHAVGPSHDFWNVFRKEIRAVNPEAVMIGEAWLEGIHFGMLKTIRIRHKYLKWLFHSEPGDIQREYTGEMDGVLDFYFRHRITEYIAWKEDPAQYEKELALLLNRHYARFPKGYFLPSFIDNHDMNRFMYDTGQNREKLKRALKLQFSLPHPPIIYYGTECGLSHHRPVELNVPFSDLHARQPMPWDHLDWELIRYCQELIMQRKKGFSQFH